MVIWILSLSMFVAAYSLIVGLTWGLLPDDFDDELGAAIFCSMIWPLVLPMMLGHWLMKKARTPKIKVPKVRVVKP